VAETSERTRAAEEDFTEDPRYAASRREMIISFAYFGTAWVIGHGLSISGRQSGLVGSRPSITSPDEGWAGSSLSSHF
jgi:hypothetical protein